VPGACAAAAPIADDTAAPHKAARDACEPNALKATRGLIEAGARIVAVDAAALVEARHIARAAATLANFIEGRAI